MITLDLVCRRKQMETVSGGIFQCAMFYHFSDIEHNWLVVLSCERAYQNFSNCCNARQILVLAVFDFRAKPSRKFGRYVITRLNSISHIFRTFSIFSDFPPGERINAI